MEMQMLQGLCWFTSGKLLVQFSILCSGDIFTLYLYCGLQANPVLNSSPQGSPSYVPRLKSQLLIVLQGFPITGNFEGNSSRMWCAVVGNLSYPFWLLSVLFQVYDGFISPGWKDPHLICLEKHSAKIKHKKIPRKVWPSPGQFPW